MQRLNIPLHRYQNATRLSRRVVSQFAVAVAAGTLVLVVSATVWYGRDTTSSSAPQDTVVVFHFTPNRLNRERIEQALREIPLISNRPLTAPDIEPLAHGEFSLFVSSDGTRSLAIRARKEELPMKTLDALGIIAQETAPGVILLSDRPLARMEWAPRHIWFGSFHAPWVTRIGALYAPDDPTFAGTLYASDTDLAVRLARQHGLTRIPWNVVPNGTITALSTPALPNVRADGVTSAIDTILSYYHAPSASFLASHVVEAGGTILMAESEGRAEYLIATNGTDFPAESRHELIQTAAALQIPKIQPFSLPDDTTAQEIIVDPSLTTIEETTVGGTVVSRASTGEGGYLFDAEQNGVISLTNAQRLLEFSLSGKKTGMSAPCSANVAFIDMRALLDLSRGSVHAHSSALLSILTNSYRVLTVEDGIFHTTIKLCR